MSNLLRKLQTESFLFTLRNPIASAPALEGYGVKLVDDHTLEVEMSKEQNLNDIFARLSAQGVEPVANSPEEMGAFVKEETVRWRKVIQTAGVTLE